MEKASEEYLIERSEIKEGYLKWITLPLAAFTASSISIFSLLLFIRTSDLFVGNLIFLAFLISIFFWSISIIKLGKIYTIYSDVKNVDEQCNLAIETPFAKPTQKLNTNLMNLRFQLVRYAKGTSVLFPLEGYYSSQLQKKIDLLFTLISDGLYGKRIESQRKNGSEKDRNEISQFYRSIKDWNHQLALQIFRERGNLRSNGHLATLASFFESSLEEMFTEGEIRCHREEVDSYYNRKESSMRARWDNMIDLAKLIIIAVLSALFAVTFK